MCSFLYVALALVASCASLAQGQVIVDTSRAPDLQEFGTEIKNLFEEWYSYTRDVLSSPDYEEPGSITLQFRETLEGINAYTYPRRNRIIANAEFYRAGLNEHDNETMTFLQGTMYHELVHVIQQYRNCPGWFYEGFADLYRYYFFHKYHPLGVQSMPSKPLFWAGQHYTQGYQATAYFLNWLNWLDDPPTWLDMGNSDSAAIKIHKVCRAGTYSDNIFETIFGKSKDQLWKQMIHAVPPGGFRVELINVPDDMQSQASSIQMLMERMYVNFNESLHSPTYEELDVIFLDFDPNVEGGIAAAPTLKAIKVEPDYIRQLGDDYTNVLIAMVHVMQQYKEPTPWLFSGIAYMTAYNENQKPIPTPARGSHYTDGDLTSAFFLNWLNSRYRPHGKPITHWLNRNSREGTYSEIDFRRFTGRTGDMLWNQMMALVQS